MRKLVNELLDIFLCMGEQEMKSIFLQLHIALAHEAYTFLKSWKSLFQQALPFPSEVERNSHKSHQIVMYQSYSLPYRFTIFRYESRKMQQSHCCAASDNFI